MKKLTEYMVNTIQYGTEARSVEFKSPMGWFRTKKHRKSEMTKAALAMSNTPGGGIIVVGISQKRNRSSGIIFERKGVDNRQYKSFDNKDDVARFFNGRSNQSIKFDIYGGDVRLESGTKKIIVIKIFESENFIPIICTQDFKSRSRHSRLIKDTIYIRSISDPVESKKISSQEEWEEMIVRLLKYKEEILHKDLMIVCRSIRGVEKKRALKKKISERAKSQYETVLKRETLINMEELINKIKERGYWKVIIRPTEFKEKRIPDRDDCERFINGSKIQFSGWDYPHINYIKGIVRSGPDSVASFTNLPEDGRLEYWKFYQNGQFVHYFTMLEDYRMDEEQKERVRNSFSFSIVDKKIDIFLSVLNTLYSITEIYFFAAELAKLAKFNEKTQIIIELGNTKGRTLFFWGDTFRVLPYAYTCEYEPIIEEQVIPTKELISDPANLALDFTMDIFKEFNWKNPNRDVFLQDQKKLIGGRL